MPANVDLSFTNGLFTKSSQEPYFLSDNGIEGSITIHDQVRWGFDLVKISLEGVLFNSIRYAEWPKVVHSDARKLQVLLRMSDVKKRSDFVRSVQSGRTVAKCSFHFHIPHCLGRNLLGEDSEYLSDLPASLSCSETFKDEKTPPQSCLGESRIYYTIRADVIRREVNVSMTSKFVRILPTLKPRPPVYLSHFDDEYTTESIKSIRGKARLSISKVGSCKIEASEPEPVVLTRLCDPISIFLPLKITLQPSKVLTTTSSLQRARRDTSQFQEQCETIFGEEYACSSALVASTYISVTPRRGVPTQAEADNQSTITRNVFVCSRATTTLSPSNSWTQDPETGAWQTNTTAELVFMDFQNDEPLVPSFDSSMISHRFRLALRIVLNAPSRMAFALDVPIMIRYSGETSDQPPSFDEIYPMLEANADTTAPLSLTQSLEQRFETVRIVDLLRDQQERSPQSQDIDLLDYHPRAIGTDAPPYVV